jgi:hypothetical protein
MRGAIVAAGLALTLLASACAAPNPPPVETSTPIASPSPRIGLTQEQAISIARQVSGAPADWGILLVEAGWQAEIIYPAPATPISTPPATGSGYVWYVNIGFNDGPLDGAGVTVILDYFDGHVVSKSEWVS